MHIGLDVGTSGVKAAAFDCRGRLLGDALKSYDWFDTADGKRELDPEEIWAAVKTVLAEVLRQSAGKGTPQSITVASLGEAIVPVGREGNALCPIITGTDKRGLEELEWLTQEVGEKKLAGITGANRSVIYSANKILWLKKHRPELWGRVWKILNVQDFVICRLSGECVMDRSIASRTLLYDVDRRDWSGFLLERTGISRDILSAVRPSGAAAGALRPDVAREMGAPPGIPVAVGAHDHVCNALGCGVVRPGWAVDNTGTTEGLTAIMENRMSGADVAGWNISCEPFVVEGMYNTVAWQNTAGVLLKWYAGQILRDPGLSFAQLDRECGGRPTGLLALPHFSGGCTPDEDPLSKGAILGLTLATTRGEIYRALMEGACFEMKRILNAAERCGIGAEKLVACGGAAKSGVWLQIKADIFGRELYTSVCEQNGALGCAMLGAVACGDFPDVFAAARSMTKIRPAAEPDPGNRAVYAERMEQYDKLYRLLKDVNHSL